MLTLRFIARIAAATAGKIARIAAVTVAKTFATSVRKDTATACAKAGKMLVADAATILRANANTSEPAARTLGANNRLIVRDFCRVIAKVTITDAIIADAVGNHSAKRFFLKKTDEKVGLF